MSHNMDVKTKIKDKKALCNALERMGFKDRYEVYNIPEVLMNYMGTPTQDKADIIIRKKYIHRLSNDFGFSMQADGTYKVIVDDGYIRDNSDWVNRLSTFYGVEKMKIECKNQGHQYYEDTDEKNRPRLRINTGAFGSTSSKYTN